MALDPNVVTVVGGILAALGGWAWRKVTGDRAASLHVVLWDAVLVELDELLLDDGVTLAEARVRLARACYELLAELGIKKATAAPFVTHAIARGVIELRRRVAEQRNAAAQRRLPAEAEELVRKLEQLAKAFDPPKSTRAPTVPTLDIEMERIE